MLQKRSKRIADALERAAAADQCAREATDPALRSDFERMARDWRMVARSLEFLHRDLQPSKPNERE
jgi:hypothetical protein